MNDIASISLPQRLSPSAKPEIEWLEGDDGAALAYRSWRGAAGQPVLLYLHGIEGHGQWFEHTARVLQGYGFSVYAPDRRGAGANRQQRGHLSSFKRYLADVEQMLRHMQSRHPDSPIVMFGNCWGAKAAAVICANGYQSVSGKALPKIATLILTCPALFTRVDLPLATKALIGLDVLLGGLRQMRQIDIPIAVEMFTDNSDFIKYIDADPLRLKAATSRFYFENFLLSLKAKFVAKRIQLPLLLVQTDKDKIVDFAKVQGWFQSVGSNDKALRTFENASHSIDFDQRWFADYVSLLVQWLNEKAVKA